MVIPFSLCLLIDLKKYPIKKIHIFILNQIQVLLQIQTEIDEGNST